MSEELKGALSVELGSDPCGHEKRIFELQLCLRCDAQRFVASLEDLSQKLQEMADALRPEIVERLEKVSKGVCAGSNPWAAFTQAVSDEAAARASEDIAQLCEVQTAVEAQEALVLRSPPTQARCRCCNRRLTDGESIAAGEGPLCRQGLCRSKRVR